MVLQYVAYDVAVLLWRKALGLGAGHKALVLAKQGQALEPVTTTVRHLGSWRLASTPL